MIKKNSKNFVGIAKKDLKIDDDITFIRNPDGEWWSEEINITESMSKDLEKKYQEDIEKYGAL